LAKWLATAAHGADRAITGGLRVDSATERGSFWGELTTTATLAANDSFRVRRGFVYPPAMTDHSAQNHAESHASSVLLPATQRAARIALD
jgi:hypothetical protein